jgi:hypothetical protein
MWKCYVEILRAIHREGQIKGGVDGPWIYTPWNELAKVMRTYPQQLEKIESERLSGRFPDNTILPGFERLFPLKEQIERYARFLSGNHQLDQRYARGCPDIPR